ncbi:hypothetical protein SAMN05421595_1976 [Austwickia chelonae]|uniref:Uncharacterized protein n=1 Tax=Austwickia chelonae NBRC 105200 TaxID=1184607 RepID=K6UL08_9MICO|nr:hypothetical protein [Austwickia chelonae]GAB76841.1 hypothetical protein AUCHE_03_00580 [Austwickia chelonae NBRC 105200]SEW31430.1 hypothetical protein SAMN05421595_1976 [Austwickia chelonae]
MPPLAWLRNRRIIGVTALLLPLSAFAGQAAAAPSASVTPRPTHSCLPRVEPQVVPAPDYWEPRQIKLNGTFPAGCPTTPGSQVVFRPRLPAGTQVLSGTYALPGVTMSVDANGTVTFRFNRSASRTPVTSFAGSVFLDLPRERYAPGSTTIVDWTVLTGKEAMRMSTPITMPPCPTCAGKPFRSTTTAQIGAVVEKGNVVHGQVRSATLSQLALYRAPRLSLDARLGEGLNCLDASLWDVWGPGADERAKISDLTCHEGGPGPGGAVVPPDRLRSGHHYLLEITARTNGFRAEGYRIAGKSTLNGSSVDSPTVAAWSPGQRYGGTDGPEVPVPLAARLAEEPPAPVAPPPDPDRPVGGIPLVPVTEPPAPTAPLRNQPGLVLYPGAANSAAQAPMAPQPPPVPAQAPGQAPAPPAAAGSDPLPGLNAPSILTGPPDRITSSAPQRVPVRSAAAVAEAAAPLAGRLPTSGTEIIATGLYAVLLLAGGLGLTAMRQQAGRQGG